MSQEGPSVRLGGGGFFFFGKWACAAERWFYWARSAAALPHGTIKPQKLKRGETVVADRRRPAQWKNYQSDVTRHRSFSAKHRKKWARAFTEIVPPKAQDAALDAARARDRLSGTVDDAARKG